ncbi:MAG: SsrA-binding protein SmpB [Ignavibacteriota bacterium]|nr:SsrA-binding protein SmpB [Ignavibacteriota bacterium]
MIDTDKIKIIGTNRKANFEYEILNRFEAGIVLLGTEVKSLREGKVNLTDAYGKYLNNELWLFNAHINEYKFGNLNNHDPLRKRKLLMNKKELRKIKAQLEEKGLTLVVTKIYFKNSKIKVEIALGRGKKLYDKRETIKSRDTERKLKDY